MIIIEAGSTQTKVCTIKDQQISTTQYFAGISPTYMSDTEIEAILKQIFVDHTSSQVLHYYGTGCFSQKGKDKLLKCITSIVDIPQVFVYSDLLAAARALAQNQPAQINILGTGSASCLYDGKEITQVYFNSGYLFGDYGSGYHIGLTLLKAHFQNQFDPATHIQIQEFAKLENQELIQSIYASDQPKSVVANFAKCAAQLKSKAQINKIIEDSFYHFIQHQIKLNSAHVQTPQYFAGSIAHHFEDQLYKCLKDSNLSLAGISASPIEDLAQYHLTYSI